MIKYFCDCCGKEKSRLTSFSYLCHIDGMLDGKAGYVDNELNEVSGRSITKHLCNECYNRIMIESVKKFREIKEGF